MIEESFSFPILQPLPILTKGFSTWKALSIWIKTTRKWKLIKDWTFVLPDGVEILIEKGFIFDGASTPRILWGLVSPTGILLIPGLIHDYAYSKGYLLTENRHYHGAWKDRSYWDKLFRDIAIQVNGFKGINYTAWLSLVLFGWIAWNKHRRSDDS